MKKSGNGRKLQGIIYKESEDYLHLLLKRVKRGTLSVLFCFIYIKATIFVRRF